MEKQKAPMINDRGIKPNKIRKIETPILSQNQVLSQIQSHYQSTSQIVTQTIDDPVANDDLDRLMGIWNHARENQFLSITDNQGQLTEQQEQLAQANLQIDKLESSLRKVEEENVTMTKYLESEVMMQNELIEKQNVSLCLMTLAEEHTHVITDTLRHCEESRKDLAELYEQASLKQEEDIKKLTEQSDNQVLKEREELTKQLELKNSELLNTQTRCEQYKNEIAQITQQIFEVNVAVEERERLIHEKRIKYEEEIRKISDSVKNVEEHLIAERQENSKLMAENEQRSKQLGDLLSQQKCLQITSTQFEEQIEHLKFSLQELKEEETNLVKKIVELNSAHLALVSNKNLELEEYRKQLENLTLTQTETTDKLIEATSNNKELTQTIAERVETIEQLKNALQNKDDETVKRNANLTCALKKQEELYSIIQNVKQQLIARENEVKKIKVDSEYSGTDDDERVKRICEKRTRLITMKKLLEDKCHAEAQLLEKIENDKIESTEQVKNCEQEIVHKGRHITELAKIGEDFRKKTERKKTEHNKKVQGLTRSLKQCKLAEHEKQIEEQSAKIDALERELAAEKLKLEERNVQGVGRYKRKAVEKTEYKELNTQFAHLKERYSIIKQTNEDLDKKWKEAQALNEAENARKLLLKISSPLLAMSYTRNKTIRAASTPNQSTSQAQRPKFDSDSPPLDLSSINGSTLYEDPDQGFDILVRSNKTDAAKLSEPEAREEIQKSPTLSNVQVRAGGGKFFKRYGGKK